MEFNAFIRVPIPGISLLAFVSILLFGSFRFDFRWTLNERLTGWEVNWTIWMVNAMCIETLPPNHTNKQCLIHHSLCQLTNRRLSYTFPSDIFKNNAISRPDTNSSTIAPCREQLHLGWNNWPFIFGTIEGIDMNTWKCISFIHNLDSNLDWVRWWWWIL